MEANEGGNRALNNNLNHLVGGRRWKDDFPTPIYRCSNHRSWVNAQDNESVSQPHRGSIDNINNNIILISF